MKNKRLWILLGAVVLINSAFLLLNFRVAMSNTQAIKTVVTTGVGDDLPDPLPPNDTISIALSLR